MVRSGRPRPGIRTLILLLFLFFVLPRGAFAESKDIVLDADKVVFDSVTGMAEAEGDSRMRHENMRIFSHRLELDTERKSHTLHRNPGSMSRSSTAITGSQEKLSSTT